MGMLMQFKFFSPGYWEHKVSSNKIHSGTAGSCGQAFELFSDILSLHTSPSDFSYHLYKYLHIVVLFSYSDCHGLSDCSVKKYSK